MRIIFMGTPHLAVPALEALARTHTILAVITQPDRPRGRGLQTTASPVKLLAQQLELPVLQPASVKAPAFLSQIQQMAPDLGVVVAYGQMLPKRLLNTPVHGCINLHFSLLPRYRGASPIQAAILDGQVQTGISIIRLTAKMDAGPLLAQQTEPLRADETAGSLAQRLAPKGAQLLVETVTRLAAGECALREQDHTQATYCYQIRKKDGQISWHKPAQYLERFVRAMTPWPGAHTTLHLQARRGQQLRINIKKAACAAGNAKPGIVTGVDRHAIEVATGEGSLRILELQRAGKKNMAVADFIRGTPVQVGDYLE